MKGFIAAIVCATTFFISSPNHEKINSASLAVAKADEPKKGKCNLPKLRKIFKQSDGSIDRYELYEIKQELKKKEADCKQRRLVYSIMNLTRNIDGKISGQGIEALRGIIKNHEFNLEQLQGIHFLVKKSDVLAGSVLDALGKKFNNKRIRKKMLSKRFALAIEKEIAVLKKHPENKEALLLLKSLTDKCSPQEVFRRRVTRKIMRIVKYINRKAGDDSNTAIRYLSSYTKSPRHINKRNAKKMIVLAQAVVKKNDEMGREMRGSVIGLLENRLLDGKMVALLTKQIKYSKQAPEEVFREIDSFLRYAPDLKKMAIYILRKSKFPGYVIAIFKNNFGLKMAKDRKFINRMIKFVESVADNSSDDKNRALEEFVKLMEEPWFTQEMFGQAKKLAQKSGSLSHRTFHAWAILKESGYKKGEKTELISNLALTAKTIALVSANSEFAYEFWYWLLADEKLNKLAVENRKAVKKILKLVRMMELKKMMGRKPGSLKKLLSSGYPLNKLDLLKTIIQKNSKITSETFELLNNFISNPGFNPIFLSKKLVQRFSSLAVLIQKKKIEGTSGLFDIEQILSHKKFKPGMLKNLQEIIDNAAEDETYKDGTIHRLKPIMEHKNFDSRTMAELAYLAKKTGIGFSHVAFGCYKAILESKSYKPLKVSKKALEELGNSINFLARKIGNSSIEEPLEKVFTSPKFHKEMLHVMKKLAERSGKAFDLLQLGYVFAHRRYKPSMLKSITQVVKAYPNNSGAILVQFNAIMDRKDFNPNFFKIKNVKWWSDIIDQLEEGSRGPDSLVGKSANILERVLKNPKINPTHFASYFKKAKKFAKSIGADYQNPEVCLNFIYAISVIGKKKTSEMYKKLGIEYFARYSRKTLNYVYDSIKNRGNAKNKPILLMISNKADWNGAFYDDHENIDKIRKAGYYRMFIAESGTERNFFTMALFAGTQGKIDTFIIGGHGSPKSIQLGNDFNEDVFLELTDKHKMKAIRSIFIKKPLIILISCSTGKDENSIGALFSRLYNARTIAPKEPDALADFEFENKGRIKSAKYSKRHSEFINGKLKEPPSTPDEFYQ
jgi:hypothetical protein